MRGQRSAEPDGRHRADSVAEKINACVYLIFSVDGARAYYKRSLGENGKFLRGSFKCGLFYAAGGNASPFLVKARKLTDVGEAHLRSHRGNGKLAAFQQGVRFR